ncbi:BREX protein BrxB domain-containing protein [uncultured Microbacterium sp.]|uniref:BREX protein BrxB domain-containing protein n=1 Tax=uncultured Microbacterium sp. TaxID=191216 RepID=UPI00262AD612|nr:BREX protein BrxB domain-containing protein [uncultured Microbacterium sp.]
MSRVSDLVYAYKAELSLTWKSKVSGGERVWMLVYPPGLERQMRHAQPDIELATAQAGRVWAVLDVSDDFGLWLSAHRHAEAFYEDPSDLTPSILDQFETTLVARIRQALEAAPENAVVALVGIGSIFPFLRASSVIKSIESAVTGRLLVLFPGIHDPETHSFRLLDARDGFNYRARVIDPQKDIA